MGAKRKTTEDGTLKKKTKMPKKENTSFTEEKQTDENINHKLSENTLKALEIMGLNHLEKVQKTCILHLLEGNDLVATIKTKSKTNLSFLIPAIESISKTNTKLKNGTVCIIISSTRESALQTFCVLKELKQFHQQTCCLLIDGSDRKTEERKLCKGANIIVATPGRLLFHLENTPGFMYKNFQMLILNEIDRILDIGCENDLKQILDILPSKRQTALFMREKINIDDLVTLTMKNNPIYVDEFMEEEKIVENLNEEYVLAPWDKRFHFLLSFLEKNKNRKVIVLFSSCLSTKHYHDLFTSLDVPVSSIHGKQKHTKRTQVFTKFCTSSSGILLCADASASELDFPKVDWILQYDPPENPKEHINRLSEITKESKGKFVLVLSPEEVGFLSYLKEAGVSTNEIKISWSKIKNVQLQLEKLIAQNYFLNLSAKEAFKSFVKFYDSHHLKEIFDIKTLDLTKVAKSYGFTVPPAVDLSITEKESDKSARPEKRLGGGGYGFFKTLNNDKKKRSLIFKQVGKRKNIRKISS